VFAGAGTTASTTATLIIASSARNGRAAASYKILQYHYHQQALAHEVGGWVFPAEWQFEHDQVMSLLLAWQAQQINRIKGVLHTNQGWLFFNVDAGTFAVRHSEYRADSRLELIAPQARDWAQSEAQLLATLLTPAQSS